jgi:hypothetical protein
MTSNAALDLLLLTDTFDARVVESVSGTQIGAKTARTYDSPGEATAAAHELLARIVRLGYGLQGALVGAERGGDGEWHGALVEVFLAPVAITSEFPSAA